jgi:phosphoglycolate phosphatase
MQAFTFLAHGVLFDLDGTLVDSAPDLAGAANYLREQRGLAPLALSDLRPFASHGAAALIGAALGVGSAHPEFADLRQEFLDYYASHSTTHSILFEGVAQMLEELDAQNMPWGIVTNKHSRFTQHVVAHFGFDARAKIIVSGDTLAHAKPHPAPLLHAAAHMQVAPSQLMYVGDDVRDIQAARAAQFGAAIAVSYGYGERAELPSWAADAVLDCPSQLATLLQIN